MIKYKKNKVDRFPRSPVKKEKWIYVLNCNGGKYVGQSIDPKSRHKILRVLKIEHTIELVKRCKSYDDANESEVAWIWKLRNKGENVFNLSDGPGAYGCKQHENTRIAISKSVERSRKRRVSKQIH